jgi:hypothetical protein
MEYMSPRQRLRRVRAWLVVFTCGLVVAGLTAFPLNFETRLITDWLGFGHLMIAVAFIGPIRDPVRNKWVVQFGIIACVLVIPLALIFGPLRGIPAFWTPIDCSFGVVGLIPLLLAYRHIRALEREPDATAGATQRGLADHAGPARA